MATPPLRRLSPKRQACIYVGNGKLFRLAEAIAVLTPALPQP